MPFKCCQCGRIVPGELWENGKQIEIPDFLCFLCNYERNGVTPGQVLNGYLYNTIAARNAELNRIHGYE